MHEITIFEMNNYFSSLKKFYEDRHFIQNDSTHIPQMGEFLNGGTNAGFGMLGEISNVGKTTRMLQLASAMAINGQSVLAEQPQKAVLAKALSDFYLQNGGKINE